jgi:hypothetical protein
MICRFRSQYLNEGMDLGLHPKDYGVPSKLRKDVAFCAQKTKITQISRTRSFLPWECGKEERGNGGEEYEVCDYRRGCGGHERGQPGKEETT